MKINKKYQKSKEELELLNDKQLKKYFTKKKKYLAIKSMGSPKKALPAFHDLLEEMRSIDYITEEEHKEIMNDFSQAINDYHGMSPPEIMRTVKQDIKGMFSKKKEEEVTE